jgi:energy-coupling factor transporter ATP-binding protein EcfA2
LAFRTTLIFPEGLETSEITRMLCSVGFASPPDWLKSYACLSQREKMRVDIARALCLDRTLTVFDEFTSVVDREIAKVSAFAISKAVRRLNKKFIAVTCDHDVVDWLDPDWFSALTEGWDYTTGAFLWRNNNTVMDIGVNDGDCGPAGPIILIDGANQQFVAYDVKTGK